MLEIDEQIAKMLDLVIERKLRLNKLSQTRCIDNENDEDDRICEEKSISDVYKSIEEENIECCYIE